MSGSLIARKSLTILSACICILLAQNTSKNCSLPSYHQRQIPCITHDKWQNKGFPEKIWARPSEEIDSVAHHQHQELKKVSYWWHLSKLLFKKTVESWMAGKILGIGSLQHSSQSCRIIKASYSVFISWQTQAALPSLFCPSSTSSARSWIHCLQT